MKTIKEDKEKNVYFPPLVERIRLDNEISLALESAPGDPETYSTLSSPDYFNNDPYKTNFG